MKSFFAIAALAALIFLSATPLHAQPKNGPSIGFGGSTLVTTETPGGAEVASGGYAFRAEYQFALGRALSANVGYSEIGGSATVTALPTVDYYKYSGINVGLRLWFGALFAGVHAGAYPLSVTSGTTLAATGTGTGGGLEAGFEGKGGWLLALRTDAASGISLSDGGPTVDAAGTHLLIGYRWK